MNIREDKIAMLFLIYFNLVDDYTKLTSDEIRSLWYEMEDELNKG